MPTLSHSSVRGLAPAAPPPHHTKLKALNSPCCLATPATLARPPVSGGCRSVKPYSLLTMYAMSMTWCRGKSKVCMIQVYRLKRGQKHLRDKRCNIHVGIK